jgi:hypothetical protein
MSTTILDQAEKAGRALVVFNYDEGLSNWKVTNANATIRTFIGEFAPDPSMIIKLPPETPAFARSIAEVTIDLNKNYVFLQGLVNAQLSSLVDVIIYEYFDNGTQTDLRYRFRGKITSAENNAEGVKSRVRLDILGSKGDFNYSVGLMNAEECISPFGNPVVCKKDLSTIQSTHISTVISGRKITIPGVPNIIPRYYNGGTINNAGITGKIKYRNTANPDEFILASYAPEGWANKPMLLTPGCDKTRYMCSAVHLNQDNFLGLGVGRLNRNPLFESQA